jgi:hypothetical protein
MPSANKVWDIAKWAWDNRAGLKVAWDSFQQWLRRSRILVIGPGGTGKTTMARILAGRFDWLRDSPWRYEEDVGVQRFKLKADPAAEIVVMPGQEHRRHTSWTGVGKDLAAGTYHGVILVSAYGYHSLSGISYKQHAAYEPERDKDTFLRKYLEANRRDEVACLKRLVPFIKECPRKLWLVSAVTKQDLWRPDESAVEKCYREGDYGVAIDDISRSKGATFRHEPHLLSLVIGNFVTARDETLTKNVQGYDHRIQIESVRRLFEIIDGVRKWGSEK